MPTRISALLMAGSGLLLALYSCQHDQMAAPNPCRAAKANPLTFQFLEDPGTPTPDTAYNSQTTTFVGPGAPYTAYEWLVGPMTRRTTQKFALFFDKTTLGSIPVRLIARRPLNTACFPNDDGVDTLTKVLTLMPRQDPRAAVLGKFRGANISSPRDTVTVRIYQGPNFDYPTNPAAEPTNYAGNLPRGCGTPYREIARGWNGVFLSLGGCTGLQGTGYLLRRDSLRIAYRTQNSPTIVDEVFLGRRVR